MVDFINPSTLDLFSVVFMTASLCVSNAPTYLYEQLKYENLSLGLRRFRKADCVRHVWVDAVCINQSDNAEKSKQVAMMGVIYSSAQAVLVWLGPGDEYTGNIIGVLKRIAAQSTRYGAHRNDDGSIQGSWSGGSTYSEAVKEALEAIPIDYDWSGADSFYSNPWCSRVWVVQEIALGSSAHLYCGAFDISWDDLIIAAHIEYRSVRSITAMNLRLPHKFHQIMFLEQGISRFKVNQLHPNLLLLLHNFRYFDCTDDRDRVYSLISLRGAQDVEIVPDYDKPVVAIYTDLARSMLEKDFAILSTLLYYAGVARRCQRKDKRSLDNKNTVHDLDTPSAFEAACTDLPTWVPDWRVAGDPRSFHVRSFHVNRATTSTFSAASGFRPNVKFDAQDGSLSVVAKSIDIIKAGRNLGSEPELDYAAHRDQVMLMKEFYDQQAVNHKLQTGDDTLTVFARVIIADLTQTGSRQVLRGNFTTTDLKDLWLQFASTPYQDESATEHFETDGAGGKTAGKKMIQPKTNTIKTYSQLFCYRMALKNLLDDRQFIVTNNGFAGLAPAIARAGDHIVVLAGFRTPVVLRPCGSSGVGSYYRVIGDCFVHGIMYGELFEELKSGSWDWKTLK